MIVRKPNVVYFVCHDLGRALGCYGAQVKTPRLDAFASEGLCLTQAHCASPACSPSRACAMSGRYAHTSGCLGLSHMGWPLDLRIQTTVDDFKGAGYQTLLSGTNHERHPGTERYDLDMNRDWEDWKLPNAVDNALAALGRRDKARPFYLNIATQEPHACTWKEVGTRIPFLKDSSTTCLPPNMPATPALEKAFERFGAAIACLDGEFGRFLDGLENLGLSENTLVVFTTDHGMSGPRGKGSLFGLGTEIACLMRFPDRLQAGSFCHLPVSNLSFRATLADATGIPTVDRPQGESVWKMIQGQGPSCSPVLFLERNFHGEKPWRVESDYQDCFDPIRAVRTKDYLYIRYFLPEARPAEPLPGVRASGPQGWENWESSWELSAEPRPEEAFYDLKADPWELDNGVSKPQYACELAYFRDKLETWMRETHDFIPGDPPVPPEPLGWGPHWPRGD